MLPNASEASPNGSERARARPKRKGWAVTSGRKLFIEGDNGTSAWSRRFRDLLGAHLSDLGPFDGLSAAQKSLCRRVAALECEIEQLEGRLSMGLEVDLDKFGRAASHLRRL